MTLEKYLRPGHNNFDILRVFASLAVIFNHAYAITVVPPSQDPIFGFLGLDSMGSIAVKFFFALSGMLVTDSLIAKKTPLLFLMRRSLRVFPGLALCLGVTVFVVGPIFTTLPLGEYFRSSQTYDYFLKNLMLDPQWRLPGVFSQSAYGVNGSLWTLPAEMTCYTFLASACALGLLFNRMAGVALAGLVVGLAFFLPDGLTAFSFSPDAYYLPGMFAMGALFALLKDSVVIDWKPLIFFWLALRLVHDPILRQVIFSTGLFYACLYVATRDWVIKWLKLPFDPSYGIYIYGFVIQQAVFYLAPKLGIAGNYLVAMPIAFLCGTVSWYLVERPAIRLGHSLSRKLGGSGSLSQ